MSLQSNVKDDHIQPETMNQGFISTTPSSSSSCVATNTSSTISTTPPTTTPQSTQRNFTGIRSDVTPNILHLSSLHTAYAARLVTTLFPEAYVSLAAVRPTVVYFALSSLAILGELETALSIDQRNKIMKWIVETGEEDAHIANQYALLAAYTLLIADNRDNRDPHIDAHSHSNNKNNNNNNNSDNKPTVPLPSSTASTPLRVPSIAAWQTYLSSLIPHLQVSSSGAITPHKHPFNYSANNASTPTTPSTSTSASLSLYNWDVELDMEADIRFVYSAIAASVLMSHHHQLYQQQISRDENAIPHKNQKKERSNAEEEVIDVDEGGRVHSSPNSTLSSKTLSFTFPHDSLNQFISYISRCQSVYEGGFCLTPPPSSRPGSGSEGSGGSSGGGTSFCEAHGGSTFCAVASMALLCKYYHHHDHHQQDHHQYECDWDEEFGINTDALVRWLILRQEASESEHSSSRSRSSGDCSNGLTGRPGKPADVCYSFWIGASLDILACTLPQKYAWVKPTSASAASRDGLTSFLLSCQFLPPFPPSSRSSTVEEDRVEYTNNNKKQQQQIKRALPFGGFGREPGTSSDPLHTHYALWGLILVGNVFKQGVQREWDCALGLPVKMRK